MSGTSSSNKRSQHHQPPVRGSSVQPQTNRPSLGQYHQHQSHDFQSQQRNPSLLMMNRQMTSPSTTSITTAATASSAMIAPTAPLSGVVTSHPSMSGLSSSHHHHHQHHNNNNNNNSSGHHSHHHHHHHNPRVQQRAPTMHGSDHQHNQAQMIAEFANSKHKFSSFNSLSPTPNSTNMFDGQQHPGPMNVNTIRNLYLYNAATGGGGSGSSGFLRQPQQQQQMNLMSNTPANLVTMVGFITSFPLELYPRTSESF